MGIRATMRQGQPAWWRVVLPGSLRFLLVACLIALCIGLATGGESSSVSGDFDSTLKADMGASTVALESKLSVSYQIGDWTLGSASSLDSSGWTAQGFTASGLLGGFTLDSNLDFAPTTGSFSRWSSSVEWGLEGVSLSVQFELKPASTSLLISLSDESGDLPLDASVQFRSTGADCDFAFYRADISATFPYCLDISTNCGLTASGLERATFSVSGIDIDRLPWLSLDASVSYTLTKKKLALTPVFDFGSTESCIVITLTGDSTGQLSIDGIRITGVHLTCKIGDATVEDEIHLDPAEYLLGKYWEALSLTYSEAAGVDECWDPIEFSISAYYANKGFPSYLVAEASGGISLGESRTIGLGFGFELDTDVGNIELLTFSFEYSW